MSAYDVHSYEYSSFRYAKVNNIKNNYFSFYLSIIYTIIYFIFAVYTIITINLSFSFSFYKISSNDRIR